jgi:hypothetical protein
MPLETEHHVVMSSNETLVFEQTVDASGTRKGQLERLLFLLLDDGTWKAFPCVCVAILPLPLLTHYSWKPGVEKVPSTIHLTALTFSALEMWVFCASWKRSLNAFDTQFDVLCAYLVKFEGTKIYRCKARRILGADDHTG